MKHPRCTKATLLHLQSLKSTSYSSLSDSVPLVLLQESTLNLFQPHISARTFDRLTCAAVCTPRCTLWCLVLRVGVNLVRPVSMLLPAGTAKDKSSFRPKARCWMDLPPRHPPWLPCLPKEETPNRAFRKRTTRCPQSMGDRNHVVRSETDGINSSASTCVDRDLLAYPSPPNCS